MQINERYKKFPIKFYKTEDGIYYENSFLNGKAKDLNDAFSQIKNKNLDKELWNYYDDVQDIKIGVFEPSLKDRNTKKGLYLGKLNLDLELNDYTGEHTVKYLSENPDKIIDHEKFIKKIKDTEKRQKFINDLKSGLKKITGYLTGQVVEMFSPYKTRYDLICEHCGDLIPTRSYYEEWHGKNYHIECLWDKLINENKSNEHENTIGYFLSLQNIDWPGDLDSKDTYISDLELFNINKRLGLVESQINEKGSYHLSDSQLPAPVNISTDSVTCDSNEPNDIITYIKQKIKREK